MSPARLYFRTISWHIIEKSMDGTYLAWCGASSVLPGTPIADQFPPREKTCESCFRLTALADERPVTREPEWHVVPDLPEEGLQ
jgi:hypothetical protein